MCNLDALSYPQVPPDMEYIECYRVDWNKIRSCSLEKKKN